MLHRIRNGFFLNITVHGALVRQEDVMATSIEHDENGFTCECGLRNDYPNYVQAHWSVRLAYTCVCQRQYVLYKGTVVKTSRELPEIYDSEAFGD
jgi:hypothetical protein